jgi:type I restriction enzyme S subunit
MESELPDEWVEQGLHDICRPKQHPTIPKSKLTKDGFVVFGANGVIGHYSEFTHLDRTIVITCRGATCGTVNVTPPRGRT